MDINNMVARVCSLLLITCGSLLPAHGQTIDTSLSNALQAGIASLRSTYSVKGISAAAFIPGKGMWKGTTGVSYGSVPIDTNMLLSIGSITKTFVAAEIFALVDAGQLSLDDTLGALLPPHANINPSINIRQLLGHKTGISDFTNATWENAMFADLTRLWSGSEVIDSFCTAPVGPPGSPWSYCNANYVLLGLVIEAKTGDSLHHVLRNAFLQPLGLSHTHMEIFESYPNQIAHNWTAPNLDPALAADASATPHQALWSSVEAAGGYFSTAEDMAAWGYRLYSGQLISAASLSEMLNFSPVSGGYFNGYGLGSMRFSWSGHTYWGHAGNYYGYAACLLYDPLDSISLAVLINQDCIAEFEARSLMQTLLVQMTTAIASLHPNESAIISPNPATDAFIISIPPSSSEETLVEVTDMSGRIIFREKTKTATLSVNSSGFMSGIYCVRVSNGISSSIKKVRINH